jgi:ABC-type antimicrobial peptide transport system permease subunit
VLPSFYLPGYGLKGVPLYLLGKSDAYVQNVYHEPEVGLTADFREVLARVQNGETAVSPPVADFWRLSPGTDTLLGLDMERRAVAVPAAGSVAFLPGIPPRSVTDRQGYVQARVDYLNHLFSSNAYLVAGAENAAIANLQVLVSRVIVLVGTNGAGTTAAFADKLAHAAPFPPLEIHDLDHEIGKVGTDMFIALALANMRIYLLGGLALALIAILSIAMANYVEDRRTLALLRIRGASPKDMWRFVVAMLLSPALIGLILGTFAALLAGFGLANYVWKLREIRTVVQLLPTHLVVSDLFAGVLALLVVLLIGVASGFSVYAYRRTAHEGVRTA